jgi:Xaa-Pro aminopeptidase
VVPIGDRVERLRPLLEEPLLVTDPANLRYLTGLASSNAALLVEPERLRLFTDFRYAEGARAVEGVELEETGRALYADLARLLSGRIAFEADALVYSRYRLLSDAGIDLVPRSGLVERLRAVKDEEELDAIRRASAVTSEAFARLAEEPFVGRTGGELTRRLDVLLHDLGAEGLAFETHVAAGPSAASPHAVGGDRRVERDEAVVVDAGAVVDGYCSDCTRTFVTGSLPDDLSDAYDACLEGQLAGLKAVRVGASGREVDAVARDRIAARGFGEAFGHGLGHGVGLLGHEAPTLRPESTDTLAAGNVVTVEPGIYLAGRGGIRIEDLVVVTDGEPEVLTTFPKERVLVS